MRSSNALLWHVLCKLRRQPNLADWSLGAGTFSGTRLQVSLAPSSSGKTLPLAVRAPKIIRNGPIPLAALVADQWTPHTGSVVERLESGALVVDVGCEVNGMLGSIGYFRSDPDELSKLAPGDSVTCYACCKYPEA